MEVALAFEGKVFGKLAVQSVFDWDKKEFVQHRLRHGPRRSSRCTALTADAADEARGRRDHARAVRRHAPVREAHPPAERDAQAPRGEGVRADRSPSRPAQPAAPRAHEYALVCGAEAILRKTGKKTGVILNPLVGQLKGDDVPADVRMQTYESPRRRALPRPGRHGRGAVEVEGPGPERSAPT